MLRAVLIGLCVSGLGCAAQHTTWTSDSIFDSPAAELGREHAPDLYEQAQTAWAGAEEAKRRRDEQAAEDRRTEAQLWLAAAVAEAERVRLDLRRAELQREEERWAKQLARDQEASAVVARDISRYAARAVALEEAERLTTLSEALTVSDAALDAILTRVRLNLALAEALGATDVQLSPLRTRTEGIARKRPQFAKAAEALLLDTEGLIGRMRAEWPEPRPGASTELVETAWVIGFAADRVGDGVLIRSERFFTSKGNVSIGAVCGHAGWRCWSSGCGEWTTRGGCPLEWSSRSRSVRARCNARSPPIVGCDGVCPRSIEIAERRFGRGLGLIGARHVPRRGRELGHRDPRQPTPHLEDRYVDLRGIDLRAADAGTLVDRTFAAPLYVARDHHGSEVSEYLADGRPDSIHVFELGFAEELGAAWKWDPRDVVVRGQEVPLCIEVARDARARCRLFRRCWGGRIQLYALAAVLRLRRATGERHR